MKHILILNDQEHTQKEYADKSGAVRAAKKLGLQVTLPDGQLGFKEGESLKAVVVPHGMSFTFGVAVPTNITERLMAELYKAFDHFNKELCPKALPHPVITIAPAGRRNAMGWHSKNRWSIGEHALTEINLCPEYFERPVEEVLETLIHEMVHMSNAQDGIKDCNAQQRHNKKFLVRCVIMGLTCEKMGRFGFAKTGLDAKATAAVASCPIDRSVFDLARTMTKGPKKSGTKTTGIILDAGMKENLDAILRDMPGFNNRSAGRAALSVFAKLASHMKHAPDANFVLPVAEFPFPA